MDKISVFKEFLVCPSCGKALCEKSLFADFDDNYCVNCGAEITSARNLALEDIMQEQNRKEIKKMPEMIQVHRSGVSTTDFEKILMVLQTLSQGFIPGSKKRKFMLDYEEEEQAVEFTIFKVEDETKENSQTEKMEMIKFHGWIKSFDDLKGTGLMQTTAFSVSRDTIEKIVKNIPYLAERIQLKNKVRVIADYDPQMKEVVFNHYEIKT